ncbi:uncharacterized protein LOC141642652 [Silene latifolia]|uniref:uncharacterized protein LOC141642652 n=1 Tax=Silene latifolia TaxID=37657 RepID=UPI003D78A12C
MAEEFQSRVCGSTWWNPNHFSSGGASLTSPCSVAQLGGGYDMGNFGWPHQVIKSMPNNQVYDNNSLVSSTNFDSTLDIMGFAPSPTIDWNQQNQFCKIGINEENFDSILQDNPSTRLNYELGHQITSTIINNSSNFLSQDGSPPTSITTSSNNSGDSSTITTEAGLNTGIPMSSTTSYLIQTLFEDFDDQSQLTGNTINNDYGRELMSPPCLWPKSSSPLTPPSPLELVQSDQLFNGGMNMAVTNDEIVLSNIRASLLNSLQSRSKAPSLNQKSYKFPSSQATMLNNEEVVQESKKKMNNNEQPAAKRPRIETPSSLPTFKVRKEKLGDRITALQQLVSPFGKTDTASVLHEAIEYIKFLHDQVHVLTTPYLKDGAGVQHQQVSVKICNNEETNQDLRSRGLCVVPISSTYPVTQETPVDFWTPTFGGTTFR